jgi:hypothetical protein
MTPQPLAQTASKESRIILALQAIERGQIRSIRAAAETYNVPWTTLRDRRNGMTSRRDCVPNSRKLTNLEEEAIVRYILDMDERGYQVNYDKLRDMANTLRAKRGEGPVGINWPSTFVQRVPELKTRVNRKYDWQRALTEDPEVIGGWFRLVRNTINKYGIADEDIYNFDETGFQMGQISSQLVITGSKKRQRPKTIQPGNREWVTAIIGVNG